MRYLAIAAIALLSRSASAQNVTMSLDFATGDGNGGVSALTTLPISRAWSDSVSAYFNDELQAKGPSNLVRTLNGLPNFKVIIQPLPLLADNKPVGITVYAITILRPPAIGTNWVYVNSSVGYTRSPADAASSIRGFVETTLRAR